MFNQKDHYLVDQLLRVALVLGPLSFLRFADSAGRRGANRLWRGNWRVAQQGL